MLEKRQRTNQSLPHRGAGDFHASDGKIGGPFRAARTPERDERDALGGKYASGSFLFLDYETSI